MAKDAEQAKEPVMQGDLQNKSANEKAAQRSDHLANGLERMAYKLHDFGNWLMGFIR